jgi:hypothetical protein
VVLVPTHPTSPPCPAPCAITLSMCPPWRAWIVNASAMQASRTTSPMTTTTLPQLVPSPPLMRCKSYFHHKIIIRFLPVYHSRREQIRRQHIGSEQRRHDAPRRLASPQECSSRFQPEVKQSFSIGLCHYPHQVLEMTQQQLLTRLQQTENETARLRQCVASRASILISY